MRRRFTIPLATLLAGGLLAWNWSLAFPPQPDAPVARERPANHQAIVKSSAAFARDFNAGDAKAVAAHWTENGEFEDDTGVHLRGRAAIEKAYVDLFKEHPKGKIEIEVGSVHFPAKDLAVEEGLITQTSSGRELPSSTRYSAVHVREDGVWKVALSREWGTGKDRLADIAWLLGAWAAKTPAGGMSLTFRHEKGASFITGQLTVKAKGKSAESQLKIGLDPQRGVIRSWHFDADGGHGQALWIRDGNKYVLDSVGADAGGTETASVNLLTRVSPNEITWRSIDRVVGNQPLPDTAPVKLTRQTP